MSTQPALNADQTLSDWLEYAAEQMQSANLFFGHGTDNAADEAFWLVSCALNYPFEAMRHRLDETLDPDQRQTLEALLDERISSRQPLAYILGEAWFAGLKFGISRDVLVPRSPLAELVLNGLHPWVDLGQPLRVLEVGTGCGCIALALAHYWPELRVDAVDTSEPALAVARTNARKLGLHDRVRLIHSDVYAAIHGPYDLIISNPPYVPRPSMNQLPDEYRHEPESALVAGQDGLDIVRRLVLEAPNHLASDGWLLVEVGEAQPQAERWMAEVDPIWLEFEHGGDGVFLLSHSACQALQLQSDVHEVMTP